LAKVENNALARRRDPTALGPRDFLNPEYRKTYDKWAAQDSNL
jgi:hypothetical protein